MASITVENVSKIYDEKVIGVDDISLSIQDGEFISFLGPSGCGKTSTLRMVAGLEVISEGTIFFDQERVNDIPSNKRNVAMAFENYGLYPHLTIFQNIAYPLKLREIPEKQIAREVVEVVRLLKIEKFLDQKPGGLSGGVQQRVSLARALVRKPSVLLLDEPISHLDAELRNQMRGEIKRLHGLNKTTTVYVTHDQLEALTMADRIAVMNQGKIRQVGTPREIFYHPKDLFVATFVGEPPMNIFDGAVQAEGDATVVRIGSQVVASYPINRVPVLLKTASTTDGRIKVGIRPMDLMVSKDKNSGIIAAVQYVENLGEKTLCHMTSEVGQMLFLTPDQTHYSEGDNLNLIPIEEHIHLFSAETTMAIAVSE